MNVLMMVSWYTGLNKPIDAGIFHYEQAMYMKERCNVAIFWPFDTEQNEKYTFENYNGVRIYRTRCREGIKYKIQRLTDIFYTFRKINKEFKPNVIHAHVAGGAGKYAIALGKIFNIPVIVTEHSPVELSNLENRRNRRIIHNVYKKSKLNICVSDYLNNDLKKIFPDCKFETVYNGIVIDKDVQPAKLRRDGYINTVIVGGFYDEYVKGYQYLLPALKEINKSNKKVFLHIIGGGKYKDKYIELARKLGVDNYCRFYGQLRKSDIYSIIKGMDFAISASIVESAGVFVEETMMLGKPLIVTRSGGADSLVSSDTAIVVEKENVDALIDGINYMKENFMKYDSEKISKYASNKFDMKCINNRYMNIYNQLVEKSYKKNKIGGYYE